MRGARGGAGNAVKDFNLAITRDVAGFLNGVGGRGGTWAARKPSAMHAKGITAVCFINAKIEILNPDPDYRS